MIMSGCLNPSTDGADSLKRCHSGDTDDKELPSFCPKNKIPKLDDTPSIESNELSIQPQTEDSLSLLNKLLDDVTDSSTEQENCNISTDVKKSKSSSSTCEEECTVVDVNNKDEINALVQKSNTIIDKIYEKPTKLLASKNDSEEAESSNDVFSPKTQGLADHDKSESSSNEKILIPDDGDKTPVLSPSETDESMDHESEVIDLFVQCGICKQNFSDRNPLMLGCLHIFCSDCILNRRYLNCQKSNQEPSAQAKQVHLHT